MYWLMCSIILLLLAYFLWKYQYSSLNLPPGGFRIPLIGNGIQFLLAGPQVPWKALDRLSKRYGDCYSLSAGVVEIIVLSSYECMQEVLVRDEWSGKFASFMLQNRFRGLTDEGYDHELGLIAVRKNEIWKEMRRFSQKTLRDFGFGKRLSMQAVIEAEMMEAIKNFKQVADSKTVLKIERNFMMSSVNVLWTMLTGIRYEHSDRKLIKLVNLTFNMSKATSFLNVSFTFPKLFKFVSKILPGVLNEKSRQRIADTFSDLAEDLITERRKLGVYLVEPENYVDVFLQKMHNTASDKNSMYTELQLRAMIQEFWMVGSLTTNATLNYGLLFFVLHPNVQKKMQNEIDEFVTKESIPTIEDFEKMPYTQAVILEIHRLACVVPIPIPRIVNEDTTYRGWNIRKDTIVISNHYSILMDKTHFGDPENFRPERFLNSKGEFVPDKRVAHFGFGKRYCIGVTLVNSVVPIYLMTILQKFTFSLVPGEKRPSTKPFVGASLTPYPYNVMVTERI